MKMCVRCGKKGLFLWLSKSGYCEKCAEAVLAERNKANLASQQITSQVDSQVIVQKPQEVPQPTFRIEAATNFSQIKIPNEIGKYRVKYKYDNIRVVGVQYAEPDFSMLEIGARVELIHESDNDYDKNAVRVEFNGQKLGYIAKDSQQQSMVKDFMRRDEPIYAAISRFDEGQNIIDLYMAFYRDPLIGLEGCEHMSTKLTKTSKKDFFETKREENLWGISENAPLEIEYNVETETYWVYDDMRNELGEIAKAASAKIIAREEEFEPIAFLEELTEDDEGKCVASIRIYFK